MLSASSKFHSLLSSLSVGNYTRFQYSSLASCTTPNFALQSADTCILSTFIKNSGCQFIWNVWLFPGIVNIFIWSMVQQFSIQGKLTHSDFMADVIESGYFISWKCFFSLNTCNISQNIGRILQTFILYVSWMKLSVKKIQG